MPPISCTSNGRKPSTRLDASRTTWRAAVLGGAELSALFVAEGDRAVLPYDDSVRIPGWSRLDLAARWTVRTSVATLTWRAGLDNATDRRAWREAPYQFGHAYLFPLAPRTWRVSMQADL